MTDHFGIRRRTALGLLGGALSATLVSGMARSAAAIGTSLPAWQPGMLDIHHISTGRGNCALFIFPDGTTAMIDAGDLAGSEPQYLIDFKPDASRRSGEWMGRYAKRHLAAAGRREIDYFILTHFHSDHMGSVVPGSPQGPDNAYCLTGVSDVAQILPINRFLDRDFPEYSYPVPQADKSTLNYMAFVKYQQAHGKKVERFKPGSNSQVALLRAPNKFANFQVQNLVSNGEVWTGHGSETVKRFPELSDLAKADYPTENMCSLALRLSYGKFDYYTGGDLPNFDNYGAAPWRDIETPVAQVTGPVEVAVVNHHGYTDAAGPGFVSALRPQQFIIEAWDSAHPVVNTLANMQSKLLFPADREIFETAMKPENVIANKEIRKMTSTNGHVVVRVAPGGDTYEIFVTTNADESDRIVTAHGPYRCN
ncbi:ComEC/Rec2 family competence protein [Sphingobium aquiterrae]|uniref:ComEC/Rec2 family competence protein n=1 Tax=Sphingobium aquiterrae TaxID=2038656 RepID=UPI00301606BC